MHGVVTTDTQLGAIVVCADARGVVEIHLPGDHPPGLHGEPAGDAVARRAAAQLEEYAAGRRTAFDLLLAFDGTPFQCAVWTALLAVPFGETISYGGLADRVGHPRAARAVGTVVGSNPMPILIPCHRVLPADGSLGNYSGGAGPSFKRRLLELEGVAPRP